jgi:hypothetical protein
VRSQTSGKSLDWQFNMNEPFQAKSFDGKEHIVSAPTECSLDGARSQMKIYECDRDALCEQNELASRPGQPTVLKYTRDGDYLVQHLQYGDVTCQRYLRKVDDVK